MKDKILLLYYRYFGGLVKGYIGKFRGFGPLATAKSVR